MNLFAMMPSKRPGRPLLPVLAIVIAAPFGFPQQTLVRSLDGTAGIARNAIPAEMVRLEMLRGLARVDLAQMDLTNASQTEVSREDQSGSPAAPATPPDGAADKAAQTKADHAKADDQAPPDKRVLGVLPNYRTINETGTYEPIDAKHKLIIASKDSFDYPLVLLAGVFAGLSQLDNSNPSYHQGVEGFAKRLAANYANQAIGNMMTEGFFPSMLHEDPRYRRIGPSRGTVKYRTWYAFSRIFVTRTDAGGTRFNYSEWLGNATGVAISNLYQPDQRDWRDNATSLLVQCGTDGISQVLKEFWPDIKHKLFHKNPPGAD
jgi:hypothetical protein